jgi:hypothetical protein
MGTKGELMSTTTGSKRVTTSIPQPILVGEAMLLHRWCSDDREILVQNGLDWNIVESLPALCRTCDTLYIEFNLAKKEKGFSRKKLVRSFKNASRVRSLIAQRIRYALSVAEIDRKLPAYSKRKSIPAILADLKEVAALCTHFKEVLDKTGFRQQRAKAILKCADLKEKELLTYAKLKLEYKDLKKNYLQTYRNLYNASQAIRNCAFSIIPIDSKRRKGYTSHYRKSFY